MKRYEIRVYCVLHSFSISNAPNIFIVTKINIDIKNPSMNNNSIKTHAFFIKLHNKTTRGIVY